VRFLPIGNTASLWAQEIAALAHKGIVPNEPILEQLEEQAYTAQAAVRYYTEVLAKAVQDRQRGTSLCD